MKFRKTLWFFACLGVNLSITSIISSSCGHNEQKPNDDPLNYDQKFGFDKSTYTKLEDDFKQLLSIELQRRSQERESSEEQEIWDKKIAELGGEQQIMFDLNSNLENFKFDFFDSHGAYYAHSANAKTQSLMNFAKQNYGINLHRQVDRLKANEECDEIKTSYLNYLKQSLEIAYKNDPEKATKISNKIDEFNSKFQEYYDENSKDNVDLATLLTNLRVKLMEFMSGVNNNLTLLATQNRLKDFFSNYKIEINEEKVAKNNLFWEELNNPNNEFNPSSEPKNISNIIDNIFEINWVNDNSLFATNNDQKVCSWKELLSSLTDYKLTPYIYSLNGDNLNNSYQVNVDWQLVNESIYNEKLEKYKQKHWADGEYDPEKDPEFLNEIQAITVHTTNDIDSYLDDDDKSRDDPAIESYKQLQEASSDFSTFYWPISEDYQKETLYNTFIKNKKWNFTWTIDKNIYGIDTFASGDGTDTEYEYIADTKKLGSFGLKINNQPIVQILEEIKADKNKQETNKNNSLFGSTNDIKQCLNVCSLYAKVSVNEESKDVSMNLRLSYKNDKETPEIFCNPLVNSWDSTKDESLKVDQEITKETSNNLYDNFKDIYSVAEEKIDIDSLESVVDATVASCWALPISAAIVKVVLIAIMIKNIIAFTSSVVGGYDDYQKNVNRITLLSIGVVLITICSIAFTIIFMNKLSSYQDDVEKFALKDSSEYNFIKKMNEYKKYYENRDTFENNIGLYEKLDVIKYLNNFETVNSDFKDYKQAREDANAWDIADFFKEVGVIIAWALIDFVVSILLGIYLIKVTENHVEKTSRSSILGHLAPQASKVFESNQVFDNLNNSGNNCIFFTRTKTISPNILAAD